VKRAVSVRPDTVILPPGTVVTVRGVVAKPELNGQRGTIESYDREAGRFVVKFPKNESAKLRPGNLIA
jgi:hypothetical protein